MQYTPKDFIDLGYDFDRWMLEAVKTANALQSPDLEKIAQETKELPQFKRHVMRKVPAPYHINLDDDDSCEYLMENRAKVVETIERLSLLPTVEEAAAMPDACPAGTICVGGVVAAKNAIHPSFHSADVCCSMYLTELDTTDPEPVLEQAFKTTHFGVGARTNPVALPDWLMESINSNALTKGLLPVARRDFATQGDGNHFLFVGVRKSTGRVCIVTHHGSRGFGAKVFKKGVNLAKTFAKNIAPKDMPDSCAWLPTQTKEGQEYWSALQIVREWTKANHEAIHALVAKALDLRVTDRFWNEHNFVFKRGDTYYHAKGATPSWLDTYDKTLVPLNMEEPILITKGTEVSNGMGFLPHGAGRNMSRTKFNKLYPNPKLPTRVKVLSFSGVVDNSELPQAYKSANEVKRQMVDYGLAEVIDEVEPYGTIMAGKNLNPEPWKKKS